MMGVRRRFLFALVMLLLATGCSGADSSELSIGDQSISRSGLNDLVLGVRHLPLDSELTPSSHSADDYRGVASSWLFIAASTEYLSDQGVDFTQSDRAAARDVVEQRIRDEAYSAVPQSSEAYEALLLSEWLGLPDQSELLSTEEAGAAVTEAFRSAHVGSRLGILDAESGRIVAHSVSGQ